MRKKCIKDPRRGGELAGRQRRMWVVLENICWLREGGGIIAQELESFVEQTIFNVIETYQYTFQATISFECEGLPLRSLEKQSGHGMGWTRAKQLRPVPY